MSTQHVTGVFLALGLAWNTANAAQCTNGERKAEHMTNFFSNQVLLYKKGVKIFDSSSVFGGWRANGIINDFCDRAQIPAVEMNETRTFTSSEFSCRNMKDSNIKGTANLNLFDATYTLKDSNGTQLTQKAVNYLSARSKTLQHCLNKLTINYLPRHPF